MLAFLMIIGTVVGTSIPVRAEGNVVKRTASALSFSNMEKISYQSTDGTTKEVEWTTNITDSAEGWIWDYSTKTLTLAGINFESIQPDPNDATKRTRMNIAFNEPGNYTIVLKEGTTNKVSTVKSNSPNTPGIFADALTLQGSGSLEIITTSNQNYSALLATDKLIIKDANISLLTTKDPGSRNPEQGRGPGILVGESKYENGTVTDINGEFVMESGSLTATGGDYGISSDKITLNGGTITATATAPGGKAMKSAPVLAGNISQSSDAATTGWDKSTVSYIDHVHTYADAWTSDAANHWHAATCAHTDLKKDEATHTISGWITEKGSKYKKCTVCERIMEVAEITSGTYKYKVTSKPDAPVQTVALSGFAKGKSATSVSVKSTVAFKNVNYQITAVADKAFYKNTKIKTINISSNVTKIGKDAFKQCSKLTTAVVGNKVTEIGTSAFYKCTSLKKITIGTGIKKMGSHIFCHDKNLRDIVIKSSKLTKIGKHNLFNCKNLKIKVPSSKVKTYTKLFKNQGQKATSNVKVTK